MADPSESPFFSSPVSSSLEDSTRFTPTVLPLRAVQQEGGEAVGGCPVEDPEWDETGGGGEGSESVTTAVGEDTSASVDTAQGETEEGDREGVSAAVRGSGALDLTKAVGVV